MLEKKHDVGNRKQEEGGEIRKKEIKSQKAGHLGGRGEDYRQGGLETGGPEVQEKRKQCFLEVAVIRKKGGKY